MQQAELWTENKQAVWQHRFYDFNVWTERKRAEKLHYMHQNPVANGLVLEPDQWEWSSFRSYLTGELGKVRINAWPVVELKSVAALRASRLEVKSSDKPTLAKNARMGHPHLNLI